MKCFVLRSLACVSVLAGFSLLAEDEKIIAEIKAGEKSSDWQSGTWKEDAKGGINCMKIDSSNGWACVDLQKKMEIPALDQLILRIKYFKNSSQSPFAVGIGNIGTGSAQTIIPKGADDSWTSSDLVAGLWDAVAWDKDGKIRVSINDKNKSGLCISEIQIIAPDKEKLLCEFRRYVEEGTADARKLAESEKYKNKEILPEEKNPSPIPTELESAAGAIAFTRPYVKSIYPTSVPAENERTSKVQIRMTPGEYEPCQIAVKALKDLPDCRAEIAGELPQGLKCEIRWIECVPLRKGNWMNATNWQIQPNRLWPKEIFPSCSVKKGECQAFWLTFKSGQEMKAGKYPIQVFVMSGESKAASFEIEIEILPFSLPELKDYAWGFYEATMLLPSESKYMAEHGVNSLSIWPFVIPKNCDFTLWDKYFRTLKEAGIDNTFIWFMGAANYGYSVAEHLGGDENVVKALKMIEERVKDGRYPKNFCVTIDEAVLNLDRFKDLKDRLFRQVNENAPSLKKFGVSLNLHENAIKYEGMIDILSCNGNFAKNGEWCRKHGYKMFTYATFTGRNQPGSCRFNCGFNPWRYGADGTYGWASRWKKENPYNDLDGDQSDACVILPCWLGKPIATPAYEAFREGVDDRRYVEVYETLVKDGKGRQELLDDLKILLAESKLSNEERIGLSIFEATLDDDRKLDVARTRLIDAILTASNVK